MCGSCFTPVRLGGAAWRANCPHARVRHGIVYNTRDSRPSESARTEAVFAAVWFATGVDARNGPARHAATGLAKRLRPALLSILSGLALTGGMLAFVILETFANLSTDVFLGRQVDPREGSLRGSSTRVRGCSRSCVLCFAAFAGISGWATWSSSFSYRRPSARP